MATPQSAGLPTTGPGRRPDRAGAADLDVLHVPQVTHSPQAPHTHRPGDRTTGPRTHAA
ncbi:hypothetical protein [Streptomyces prunicolor]|jgi:hypothetical protein|uniref:hypothetical protein n=1 Tax=Streptomyces prunicolor TaxID=67348 RepID=UPI003421231D